MWVSPKEIFHQNQRYRGDITIIEKNQKTFTLFVSFFFTTGLTGLEPATSALTGRCSNQLNYKPNKFCCALIMPDHLEFCNKNKKDFYLKSWRVCHPVYNGLHLELR